MGKRNIFVMSSNMQVGMWSSSHLSILYVAGINKSNSLHLDILEMCKDIQQTMKASNECLSEKNLPPQETLTQNTTILGCQQHDYANHICPAQIKRVFQFGNRETIKLPPSSNFGFPQ